MVKPTARAFNGSLFESIQLQNRYWRRVSLQYHHPLCPHFAIVSYGSISAAPHVPVNSLVRRRRQRTAGHRSLTVTSSPPPCIHSLLVSGQRWNIASGANFREEIRRHASPVLELWASAMERSLSPVIGAGSTLSVGMKTALVPSDGRDGVSVDVAQCRIRTSWYSD